MTFALKWRVEVSNSHYSVVDFVSVDLIHSGKPNKRMKIIQKQQKEKFSILETLRNTILSINLFSIFFNKLEHICIFYRFHLFCYFMIIDFFWILHPISVLLKKVYLWTVWDFKSYAFECCSF